jgi:hypothetical protein
MIEPASETWREVEARIAEQIASIRDQLEIESTDETRTTRLRVRIRAFRDVLTWADAAPDNPNEGLDTPWQL